MRRLRAAAALTCVAASGLPLSCGGKSHPVTEEERAGQAVERFLSAVHDGDDTRACGQLTRRGQQGLPQLLVLLRPDDKSAVDVVTGSQACPHLTATLRRFLQKAGRFEDLRGDVGHVELGAGGRTATVRVHSGRLTTTWPLEKEQGGWRIAEVALGTVKKVEEEEGGEGEEEREGQEADRDEGK